MTNTPPGFYEDNSGKVRWWDGEQWTDRAQPPSAPEPPAAVAATPDRRELDRAVNGAVSAGARVESQSDSVAIVVYGKKVNHVLHVILTILTGWLWAIVWLILVLSNKQRRYLLRLEPTGTVSQLPA